MHLHDGDVLEYLEALAEEMAVNYGLRSSLIRLRPSDEIFADFGAETVPIIEKDAVIGYEIRLNKDRSLNDSKLKQLIHHELGHVKLREMGYPIYAVDPDTVSAWFNEDEIGYFAKLIDLPNEYYTMHLGLRFDEQMGWAYVRNLVHLDGVGTNHDSFVRSAVAVADAVVAKQVCLDLDDDLSAHFESTIRKTQKSPKVFATLRAVERALGNLPALPLNRFSPSDIEAIEDTYAAIGSCLIPDDVGFTIASRKIQNSTAEN